ncbi:MAG: CapA family protein [Firmicutes bacterium]|nr:CapA family protein [Bacillota bacterium]
MTTAADSKKKTVLKKTAATILLVAAACLLIFGIYRALDQSGCLLPSWTKPYQQDEALVGPGRAFWEEKTLIGEIRAELKNKKVTVRDMSSEEADKVLWTSPKGVLVQDILLCDIDHDSADELILLCWRRGSFGEHMPFWVKKNDHDWGQHIFIYDYVPDRPAYPEKIHPIWMSSAIPMKITSFSFDESMQAIYITEDGGRITGWAWLSWGLEMISEESSVSFLCAGDLVIHEPIYARALSRQASGEENGFDFLFEAELPHADVETIGQETPLVKDSFQFGGFPSFGTPAFLAESVSKAGFDIAVCATNHALDRGLSGIDSTIASYQEAGVRTIGTQSSTNQSAFRPYDILERKGIRFALLSFTYGTNGLSLPKDAPYAVHLLPDLSDPDGTAAFRSSLQQARQDADCVLVFVHWGTEYAETPDKTQQAYAQIFLEECVDVVIGTHPHVIEPYEVLTAGSSADSHSMLVFYSLGNFISANQDPQENNGALAAFTVQKIGDKLQITNTELISVDTIFR